MYVCVHVCVFVVFLHTCCWSGIRKGYSPRQYLSVIIPKGFPRESTADKAWPIRTMVKQAGFNEKRSVNVLLGYVYCSAPKPFTELSVFIRKSEHSSVLQFKYVSSSILTLLTSMEWLPVIWATYHLGDRQVGDKPTGRQPTGRHILVNCATEVETTGPQLWKCERLTIAVLEQLCPVLGQRPFNSTHKTNLPPFCLNAAKLQV